MVGEVLALLVANPSIGTFYDFDVQVYCLDGLVRLCGTFPLQRIATAPSPAQTLQDIVIDEYHMPIVRHGPANWEIKIVWHQGGRLFCRGQLRLGSPEEINAIRRAQYAQGQGRAPAPGVGGYTAPSAQAYYPAPAYAASAPPYAAQPQQQPPQQPYAPQGVGAPSDPYFAQLQQQLELQRAELNRTQGMLQEALAAAREGRQPQMQMNQPPPAGVGAPPPSDLERMVDAAVTRTVGAIFQKMGLGAPPPQAPAAPPPGAQPEFIRNPAYYAGAPMPAATPASPVDSIGETLTKSLQDILVSAMKEGVGHVGSTLRASLKESFSGLGQAPAAVEAEPPEPPPNPMDNLPFESIDTGAHWPSGAPVKWAQNRETGELDLKGVLFTNPVIAETALKIGATLAEAGKEFASRVRFPDGSSVVDKTPRGAVNGNPTPPQPPPRPAPPPPSNGAGFPSQ